ncbi:hypothetical protein M4R22_17205 [Acidovorax sp. GBBC 3334]|uniref:YopJ family acetyltransferase n=1 Tax=Acidovorax sp. GBBC 3334 TaxID=2940496 RepID=UPI002303BAEE|nr:YopJ family acetyltransferase [Acidovorax sp. GBBC 3334]MDA8456502.1 hypothetical protein [Acidovorax sp. GBBC 3334]
MDRGDGPRLLGPAPLDRSPVLDLRAPRSDLRLRAATGMQPEAALAPPRVPPRLLERAEAIDLEWVKSLDASLHAYAELAIGQAERGRQPGRETTRMDILHMPLLVEMENARRPGLHLHAFASVQLCIAALRDHAEAARQEGAAPTSMRCVVQAGKNVMHHFALDVRFTPDAPPSFIHYEPAASRAPGQVISETLAEAFPGARVALVHNPVQFSQWDCAMFSLDHVLQSFKTRERYADPIHAGAASPDDLALPVEFFKHMHSKQQMEHRPDADAIVTKVRTGAAAETLRQRVLDYRATRGEGAYSTSIEGFRLQQIRRAAEYLATRPPR